MAADDYMMRSVLYQREMERLNPRKQFDDTARSFQEEPAHSGLLDAFGAFESTSIGYNQMCSDHRDLIDIRMPHHRLPRLPRIRRPRF